MGCRSNNVGVYRLVQNDESSHCRNRQSRNLKIFSVVCSYNMQARLHTRYLFY